MNSFNVMKIPDPHKYSTVKKCNVGINYVIVSYMYLTLLHTAQYNTDTYNLMQ